jgi:hypothetical protein
MATLTFKDLSFEESKDAIGVSFLSLFYFDLNKDELTRISPFSVDKNSITFKDINEARASRKFNFILEAGFKKLRNKLNNKPTIYIHQNSGIPLIGNVAFGIVDRGTSLIEVKPITGCNLNCIYCSVDEDKRHVDFVVEEAYLINEFKKLVHFKKIDSIEAHIGTQGEPTLYACLVELVRDLSSIKEVKTVSIDTNGTLLTKKLVDELVDGGLTRFNLSINALDQKLAERIANAPYNLRRILGLCRYIAKKTEIILTPVWIPGINDAEISKLIEFAAELSSGKEVPVIGIQNFLNYKFGRNPVKATSFEVFNKKLAELEKRHKVKLLLDPVKDFNIVKTKQLPKPCKKGDIITANIVCPGRLKGEKIAVFDQRTISIPNCYREGNVRVKVVRTKHNIFVGKLV